MRREGRCLCGACRFSALPEADEAGVCHCGICRKWSGGINMAVNCTEVTWNSDAPLRAYRSSARGERVFCGTCGTNLFWRGVDDDPAEQSIGLMAFDEPEIFAVTRQIYIDEKPANYALANDMITLTGAQVRAMSAPNAGGNA
jgi:hypothetical protein